MNFCCFFQGPLLLRCPTVSVLRMALTDQFRVWFLGVCLHFCAGTCLHIADAHVFLCVHVHVHVKPQVGVRCLYHSPLHFLKQDLSLELKSDIQCVLSVSILIHYPGLGLDSGPDACRARTSMKPPPVDHSCPSSAQHISTLHLGFGQAFSGSRF